jgi:hypothetical protein
VNITVVIRQLSPKQLALADDWSIKKTFPPTEALSMIQLNASDVIAGFVAALFE